MPIAAAQLAELIDAQAATLRLWAGSRCSGGDDVVQEAFCRLAVQEPAPDNPVGWLYRVCRNLAEKQRRSDGRRRARESVHARSEASRPGDVDPLELAETLLAVERLPGDLREVLVARIWGQLPLEEIGRLCGISVSTASRRYQAALDALRTQLALPCEETR